MSSREPVIMDNCVSIYLFIYTGCPQQVNLVHSLLIICWFRHSVRWEAQTHTHTRHMLSLRSIEGLYASSKTRRTTKPVTFVGCLADRLTDLSNLLKQQLSSVPCQLYRSMQLLSILRGKKIPLTCFVYRVDRARTGNGPPKQFRMDGQTVLVTSTYVSVARDHIGTCNLGNCNCIWPHRDKESCYESDCFRLVQWILRADNVFELWTGSVEKHWTCSNRSASVGVK